MWTCRWCSSPGSWVRGLAPAALAGSSLAAGPRGCRALPLPGPAPAGPCPCLLAWTPAGTRSSAAPSLLSPTDPGVGSPQPLAPSHPHTLTPSPRLHHGRQGRGHLRHPAAQQRAGHGAAARQPAALHPALGQRGQGVGQQGGRGAELCWGSRGGGCAGAAAAAVLGAWLQGAAAAGAGAVCSIRAPSLWLLCCLLDRGRCSWLCAGLRSRLLSPAPAPRCQPDPFCAACCPQLSGHYPRVVAALEMVSQIMRK
jgi:hypothetical protein